MKIGDDEKPASNCSMCLAYSEQDRAARIALSSFLSSLGSILFLPCCYNVKDFDSIHVAAARDSELAISAA